MKIVVSQKEALEARQPGGRPEYSLLQFLSRAYNNTLIVDAGTRTGGSAVALSINPTNMVYTYDVTTYSQRPGRPPRRCAGFESPNIKFFLQDCNTLDAEMFKNVSIVYLDISHNGTDEEQFLKKLDVGFKGILVMDDISCPRRWLKLHELWESITRPKILVPTALAAGRGTGIVMYGDEVEITD